MNPEQSNPTAGSVEAYLYFVPVSDSANMIKESISFPAVLNCLCKLSTFNVGIDVFPLSGTNAPAGLTTAISGFCISGTGILKPQPASKETINMKSSRFTMQHNQKPDQNPHHLLNCNGTKKRYIWNTGSKKTPWAK